jgi:serine phosphatase RsbU (regulator of sigma subunit)
MLTDGYFEWSRPGDGEPFGVERLGEVLHDAAHGDAPTILRTMDDTVRRYCHGSPQSDDMTAIVIKRTARVARDASESPPIAPRHAAAQ